MPFALRPFSDYVASLGAEPVLRRGRDGEPFMTDQENYILDCRFGPMDDPARVARALEGRAGMVEHGLFLGLADEVIVAGAGGIRRLSREG